MKDATPAQISLAWMLHKYPNVVPIPGSKNKERIVENLNASNVAFLLLQMALKGFVEEDENHAYSRVAGK